MARYGFLKSPLWIAGVIIALVAIVSFVNLGLWQLRRLDERHALNAVIEERSEADPAPLASVVATHGTDPEALAYRRVLVEGAYDAPAEVMLVGTTLNGRSGHDVVTPLVASEGTVAVDRGWVPIDTEGPPAAGAAPPAGRVEAVGVLLPSQTHGSLGTPASDGGYARVGRIDLDALGPQWSPDLLPVYLLLETQTPAGGELPVPRPPPEPGEGPHLSYAIQWFLFALIVAVGFPALVYRTGRS